MGEDSRGVWVSAEGLLAMNGVRSLFQPGGLGWTNFWEAILTSPFFLPEEATPFWGIPAAEWVHDVEGCPELGAIHDGEVSPGRVGGARCCARAEEAWREGGCPVETGGWCAGGCAEEGPDSKSAPGKEGGPGAKDWPGERGPWRPGLFFQVDVVPDLIGHLGVSGAFIAGGGQAV